MYPFDRVVLIFNPNSTGNASGLAAELRDELARRRPDLPVMLQQTEHAGHARDLARDAALTGCPLLVSVSGDGGYNEVEDQLPRPHQQPDRSSTVRFIENNRKTSQTDNFTSRKSSRPRQPHRPSWHSWRDASTCGARYPASLTWV